jgi:sugar phosphate isomerase/epimerase
MNRRAFIVQSSRAVIGTAVAIPALTTVSCRSVGSKSAQWPIGCFNRPWSGDKKSWGLDAAFDGIRDAGYKYTGLLTRNAKEPLLGSDATDEYMVALRKRIAARNLVPVMGALRTKFDLPLDGQIRDMRKQIDHGKIVGTEFLLTFGADKADNFEVYYKLMKDAAAYAQERGMKVVLKPHGGASGAAEEIVRCLDKVGHPNFKVWFDPGNIIYYTGKDPIEQLRAVIKHVTGVCAKDCDKPKGNVWLEFGTGKVDFKGFFAELKAAGFHGPVMVECCALGDTPEAVTANARKNREYLENIFSVI